MTRLKTTAASLFLKAAGLLLAGFLILSPTVPLYGSDLRFTPIVKAVQKASPAVVNIHGRKTVRNRSVGRTMQPAERQVNGMGTGIIFDERGYILTNYHVVQGVISIIVTRHDQTTYTATLVARDTPSDLAIIKINSPTKLPIVQTGDSSSLMPGETVIAVGNAYGYQHTVTRGIVSALNRDVQVNDTQRYANLIQTDASINPGNSGGPLLNIDGEMIGVNVAVRIGAQGIGFAIPSNDAFDIAARLLAQSRVPVSLGIDASTKYGTSRPRYVVDRVQANSSAEAQGVRVGDVISSIEGVPIWNRLDYERALLRTTSASPVSISLNRDSRMFNVQLDRTSTAVTPSSVSKRAWDELGVRTSAVTRGRLGTHQKRYRGGLRVVEVREGSLAHKNGIKTQDVLLGIHKWETVNEDNLSYILSSSEYKTSTPLKFYLLRNQQILFGHLSQKPGT